MFNVFQPLIALVQRSLQQDVINAMALIEDSNVRKSGFADYSAY